MTEREDDKAVPLAPGEARRHVGLMAALYRSPTAAGQCQACQGIGKIVARGGSATTCPRCKGRGRMA